MSQRSAFTSEYIYNPNDYKILRERANKWGNHKWLCFAPEACWGNNDMPIIQGKVGCSSEGLEYKEICSFLRGVKTECDIYFVVIPEGHSYGGWYEIPIQKIHKTPEGNVFVKKLHSDTDEEWMDVEGAVFDDNGSLSGVKDGLITDIRDILTKCGFEGHFIMRKFIEYGIEAVFTFESIEDGYISAMVTRNSFEGILKKNIVHLYLNDLSNKPYQELENYLIQNIRGLVAHAKTSAILQDKGCF